MRKKGQGLSLNVVILAILAIVVLVFLIFMVTTRTAKFEQTAESCVGKGGVCIVDLDKETIPAGFVKVSDYGKEYTCPERGEDTPKCYAAKSVVERT